MLRTRFFASVVAIALVACGTSESDLGLGQRAAGGSGGGATGTGSSTTSATTTSSTTSAGGAGHQGGASQGGQGQGGGTSTCALGTADCDGAPGCETSTSSDVANCGGCGVVCGTANAKPSCVGGACVLACDDGWANCDGAIANGCETSLADPKNCGACGVVCQGACIGGKCGGPCDEGPLALDDPNAADAAKAIGLCDGVVEAKWVQPDGSPMPADPQGSANYHLGHGLLPAFGPNVHPQQGQHLLALSSGAARQPTDPGWVDELEKGYPSNAPPGYPKALPACGGAQPAQGLNDGVGLELTLAVPPGKTGFSYAFDFFSHEWPEYVCSAYVDAFLGLLAPAPLGAADGNVSFDPSGNYVSVATKLLDVCGCQNGPPCQAGQQGQPTSFACSLGTGGLAGTGFDAVNGGEAHGSTGWLLTTAPVTGGTTVKLRFTVYDSGDGKLDTTTLVDDFRWLDTPGVVVATTRIAQPK
jgi:hypothetical protein